jgi:hypothetical protein
LLNAVLQFFNAVLQFFNAVLQFMHPYCYCTSPPRFTLPPVAPRKAGFTRRVFRTGLLTRWSRAGRVAQSAPRASRAPACTTTTMGGQSSPGSHGASYPRPPSRPYGMSSRAPAHTMAPHSTQPPVRHRTVLTTRALRSGRLPSLRPRRTRQREKRADCHVVTPVGSLPLGRVVRQPQELGNRTSALAKGLPYVRAGHPIHPLRRYSRLKASPEKSRFVTPCSSTGQACSSARRRAHCALARVN